MTEFIEETVECSICFDEIGKKNNCVTPCGHVFCFSCVSKSLTRNNTCPCCRTVLVEDANVEDDDSEYEDEDDFDDDDDEEEDGHLEIINERFVKKGYNMMDMISILTGRGNPQTKYTSEYIEKLVEEVNDTIDEIDDEEEEKKLFALEDVRI